MRMKAIFKKMIIGVIAAAVLLSGAGGKYIRQVSAATPRVMLADYSVEGGEVVAGKDFTLNLTLRNTAAKTTVRNLKVTIGTEGGEFLPVESAGTAYIDKIDASTDAELSFVLHAIDGLEEKSYKVTVKTEYEDGSGYSYDVTDTIYLSVMLNQRISISDVYLANNMLQLGDTVEICGMVNNLGKGTLYNVTARIDGDNVMEQSSYIGNVESGKSGTVDVLTKADVISHNAGDKNKLIITYEDKSGNVYSEEAEFMVSVSQPVYENLEKVKESKDISGAVKQIVMILIVVMVIALIIFLAYKHWKKKQRLLEDI